MRIALPVVMVLAGCATTGQDTYKVQGDSACVNGTIPLIRFYVQGAEAWDGKKVRLRYNTSMGPPDDVEVIYSEVPEDITKKTVASFKKFKFKPYVENGVVKRQVGCEYDFFVPAGA